MFWERSICKTRFQLKGWNFVSAFNDLELTLLCFQTFVCGCGEVKLSYRGIKTSTYSPRCLETGKMNLIHRNCLLTSGHLLCEKDDHLGEVDGSGGLADHAGGFSVWDWSSDWGESGLQVAGGEDTVLKIGKGRIWELDRVNPVFINYLRYPGIRLVVDRWPLFIGTFKL